MQTSSDISINPVAAAATAGKSADELVAGSDYRIIRRNGAVVPFAPSKIAVAMTKAFLAVNGEQGRESARIRELVAQLTNNVVAALVRRQPNGGTFHIEDVQDQVELSLMRSGEHDVAREYVLYRAKRMEERRAAKEAAGTTAIAAPQIHVVDGGARRLLDMNEVSSLINAACAGLEKHVDADAILAETVKNLYDGVPVEELHKSAVLAARALMEKDPAYSQVTARILLHSIRKEIFGKDVPQAGAAAEYVTYFPQYIAKGIDAELLDEELGKFDLQKLAKAIVADRDLQFGYIGLQTLYDRYFLHIRETRIEMPQAFYMRVAMGLSLREENREARAIEFYNLLSTFDFMSSTPTLFNSGTRRSQLSSCYLTTVADDLEGIYDAIKENALLSKFAGGLGNDWTPVRALGSRIKGTNGKSQGVVPFLKVANDTAVAVNQGGKRKGAVCAYLETWHLDIEEFLDVQVPRLQVGADGALALAALVDGDGGVVGDFQERHDALRLAVRALDARAQGAHRGPVVAQATGEFRQQRVFLDGVVDAFQVVGDGGQVARRQLRAAGARVEQRRGRAHEVERRQQVVELDGARFAVLFTQGQAHRDAHVERLRHLDAGFADMQEVAVVQGLQADVAELQVAVGDDRLGQLLQVELAQFLVQQLGVDALGDVLREVGDVFGGGAGLRHVLAEDLLADRVQQDARGDLAVGRVLFHQRARGQHGRLVQFLDRHAVVQVLDRLGQDGVGVDVLFQAGAGGVDQGRHFVHVQQAARTAVDHVDLRRGDRRRAGGFLGGTALFHALGTVQHVFACDVMLARAHQGQFHLVLHILDVEGTAVRLAAHEGRDHVVRQLRDQLADARRLAALLAVDGQERLGHRDGDLARRERHHGAVTADDAVVAACDQFVRALAGRRSCRDGVDGNVRRCLH